MAVGLSSSWCRTWWLIAASVTVISRVGQSFERVVVVKVVEVVVEVVVVEVFVEVVEVVVEVVEVIRMIRWARCSRRHLRGRLLVSDSKVVECGGKKLALAVVQMEERVQVLELPDAGFDGSDYAIFILKLRLKRTG